MKKWILILAPLFSVQTLAGSAEPIRQARGFYGVYKSTLALVGDEYRFQEEKVCSGSFDLGVYDLRGRDASIIGKASFECPATYRDLPVKVGGFSILVYSQTEFNGVTSDVKSFVANSWVQTTGTAPEGLQGVLSGNFMTRDLRMSSFISRLQPNQYVLCLDGTKTAVTKDRPFKKSQKQNCQIVNPEIFSVTVEADDQ